MTGTVERGARNYGWEWPYNMPERPLLSRLVVRLAFRISVKGYAPIQFRRVEKAR